MTKANGKDPTYTPSITDQEAIPVGFGLLLTELECMFAASRPLLVDTLREALEYVAKKQNTDLETVCFQVIASDFLYKIKDDLRERADQILDVKSDRPPWVATAARLD